MTRYLFILGVFAFAIFAYLFIVKPQPIKYKGLEKVSYQSNSKEGAEVAFTLLFENPNAMRTQLGFIEASVFLHEIQIGELHEKFDRTISSKTTSKFPITVRFEKASIPALDSLQTLNFKIEGKAGSNTLLGNYSVDLNTVESIKK